MPLLSSTPRHLGKCLMVESYVESWWSHMQTNSNEVEVCCMVNRAVRWLVGRNRYVVYVRNNSRVTKLKCKRTSSKNEVARCIREVRIVEHVMLWKNFLWRGKVAFVQLLKERRCINFLGNQHKYTSSERKLWCEIRFKRKDLFNHFSLFTVWFFGDWMQAIAMSQVGKIFLLGV